MGFFDNPIGAIADAGSSIVSTVSNTVNREVSNSSNTINRTLDNASRGDVGKYTKEIVDASLNVVKAPFEVAYYGVRGENKKASESIQRAIGSSINTQGTQNGNIYNPTTVSYRYTQTNEAQTVLRNPAIREATLGISEDYAGLARGSRTLQDSAYLSREDQNSAIRLGVKAALFVVANPSTIFSSKKATATAYGIGKSLAKGDISGAISGANDLGYIPDVKDYVGIPQLPNAPSELTDLFDFLNPTKSETSKVPSYLSGSTGTQVNDPWSFTGVADSGLAATKSSSLPYLLGGALIIGTLFFLRGRK